MRVLLVESHKGVGNRATELLVSSDHEVVRCHDPSAGHPCGVFENPSMCPIEKATIDAALVVHAGGAATTGYEAGAGCARRARIPMVVYATEGHPFGTSVREVGVDIVGACERAAAGRLEEHEVAVRSFVMAAPILLQCRTLAHDVEVEVHRAGEHLRVIVRVPSDVPASADTSLADRAVRGLRCFDRSASTIDVTVEHHTAG